MRVGERVQQYLNDHAVWNEIEDPYAEKPVWLWVCGQCGYLDRETDDHPAMIVEDYIRNLMSSAWEKGYEKGRLDASESLPLLAYGGLYGRLESKKTVNPYHRGELHD